MRKELFAPLLIHMFMMWLILNINHMMPYLMSYHGETTVVNGILMSGWNNFIRFNFSVPNIYHIIICVFVYAPAVEFTYWFVFRKYSLLLSIVASFLFAFILALVISPSWDFYNYSINGLVSVFYVACYFIIYSTARLYIYKRLLKKDIQLGKSESELSALKAQINPHFLFNTLNYLYGTAISEKAEKTSKSVEILSEMMRYTISSAKENFVELKNELKFIKNYTYLQQVRLPEMNAIEMDIETGNTENYYKIPPLLILPFIENAFKYGISVDNSYSIKILIKIIGDELKMSVKNTIRKENLEIKGNNTGIANAKRRLDLLYEGKYSLVCAQNNDIYEVNLNIKLN
ncbi:sensor histidine kinase [Pedobacter jejuensis]|uniref:Histidine kinase n=1 Tax=Pedobacter jejuensis TaxID=1268550 RepID=A0A3N0BW90_9SPHI|nr:histidine kinase [Pedobacter jejuensis]RNL53977.1 histidine kinase [Pedobacter jejuensis]